MKIQTTKPDAGDPYYNKSPKGWSPCILGNNNKGQRDPGLNVLPNCCGWACGRFNSIAEEPTCRWFGNVNAENFLALGKSQGLKTGTEPKIGAVMVWSNDRTGHVAVVENVIDKNTVLTSESEWNGAVFKNYTRKRGSDGNWRSGCKWMGATYKFRGFVYQPREVYVAKEITVLSDGKTYQVKAIQEGNENYIRMRDFDDVLGIADVCWNASRKMPEIDSPDYKPSK